MKQPDSAKSQSKQRHTEKGNGDKEAKPLPLTCDKRKERRANRAGELKSSHAWGEANRLSLMSLFRGINIQLLIVSYTSPPSSHHTYLTDQTRHKERRRLRSHKTVSDSWRKNIRLCNKMLDRCFQQKKTNSIYKQQEKNVINNANVTSQIPNWASVRT